MKKFQFISAIVAVAMLCSGLTAFTSSEVEMTTLTYDEQIMEQVEDLTGFDTENAEIVTVNNSTARNRSATTEKAVKIEKNDGVILIVPKISNEANEIVNSFDYAATKPQTRDSHFQVTHLVDMTINMSAYYNQTFNWDQIMTLYTPKSMYFSWNSDVSSAYINDIAVKFDAKGDYWRINPLTDMGYEKYVSFDIYEVNPTEGVAYGDWGDAMDDNYGLVCTDYFEHGGNIWYSINYTVNGVTRYDTYSWTPFGK